jgi:hypothetical protein
MIGTDGRKLLAGYENGQLAILDVETSKFVSVMTPKNSEFVILFFCNFFLLLF